jgi:hypothetical protein
VPVDQHNDPAVTDDGTDYLTPALKQLKALIVGVLES